ncbi:hypothetical protein HPB50_007951 [Hyalomma asiaticum]|uniref:Uncharacterized protein n=1 Tax=Hyalomma asiaticum TaxID=266040 RepID=A0ACB7SCZ7_HYAAI|nr:hypothetical protein HPB50_007951 [Hyalomma asiaticum]
MSQTPSSPSSSSSPGSPHPPVSDVHLDRASPVAHPYLHRAELSTGSRTPAAYAHPGTSPVPTMQRERQPRAFYGRQQLPALAPQGRPDLDSACASPSQSVSHGLSSSDVQPLPSPFNSLLLLPSDDWAEAVPGDIRPDSRWSLPQLCIGLCAMVALLLAILFASTLAVRTLKRYDFLRSDAADKLVKGSPHGESSSATTSAADEGIAYGVYGVNVSDVAAYAPAFR